MSVKKPGGEPVIIKVRQRSQGPDELPLPKYMSEGAAGLDLLADLEKPLSLEPMQRTRIPTGLHIALPEGFEAQIRPRSGLASAHGVTVLNTPGTVDSDYRGEVSVLLINLGDSPFLIQHGDRIAQMVVAPVARATLVQVDELDTTSRGEGGFGSTGTGAVERGES